MAATARAGNVATESAIERDGISRTGVRHRPTRAVVALARVEGRRMLLHPAVLAVPLVSVVILGTSSFYLGALVYLFLIGIGFFALGAGALIAANLNALRASRHGTEELFTSLPLSAAARTVSHLLGAAFPLAAALVVAGALAVYAHPWTNASVRLDMAPQMVMHGPVDFLQGPLLVGLFAVLGVLVARWIPHPAVGVPTVVGLFVVLSFSVWSPSASHWLAPLSAYTDGATEPPTVMAIHVAYLAAVTALAAALSVLRHSRGNLVKAVTIGSVLTVAGTGALQVLWAS